MEKFLEQETPFLDALETYVSASVSPFDVPGHHMGNLSTRGNRVLGERAYRCDVNAPIGLDNLAHPSGVIAESEAMCARVCGADHAFYLINGTSSGIIAMFLTAVKAGEKVLLPRNVHKSVINALILCGAVPVYVAPEIDDDLEIANQPKLETWKKAIVRNSSCKAIFVINPTYFGSVGDLKSLVQFAHDHNVAVLVDEAHGAHYYFRVPGAPVSAMDAGADMSAASFHKTGGSLTQSSVLLLKGNRFSKDDVQASLNIINTTSPSSLLIGSLEAAASYIGSEEGRTAMKGVYALVDYAKEQIDRIPGFSVVDEAHFQAHGSFAFDKTKLVIALDKLTVDGFRIYRELKQIANVQMELAEPYAVMGVLTVGTKKEHIDHLVEGLKILSEKYYDDSITYQERPISTGYPFPLTRPRVAFNAPAKVVPIDQLDGEVSREQVMMYPPGIPLVVPGEVWTKPVIREVKRIQSSGGKLICSHEEGFEVIDRALWKRYHVYEKKLTDYLEKRKTYPLNDGYTLPFEGNSHRCTFLLMPYRRDTWRERAKPATENYLEVIRAIAEHEPVYVGIHPNMYSRVSALVRSIPNAHPMSIRYNDAWARDTLPLFLVKGNDVRAMDFRFNAWGGEVDGLYSDYADDDKISSLIAKRLRMASYRHASFVLEGGSIISDGEGTLITTEACLLSKGRNPHCSKEEIE
ncbi:MAG: aminotransferase class I/II-fold pyridoxal phosphate-dependent enzyme, partial [Candidatus Enteromonas sp.]|nr:aminotransferase class I/II-fold pyridoxal phosphate-dependent enzyme [Candidatus Enteromonas sp.]